MGETEKAGVDYNWSRLKEAVNESAVNVLVSEKLEGKSGLAMIRGTCYN